MAARCTGAASRSSEKPVSRVAVRQWQLLSGQHDLVGKRRFPQRRRGFSQPPCHGRHKHLKGGARSSSPKAN